MSGFDDIVRTGIATAHSLTRSLQVTVQHSAWIDSDSHGAPTFAISVSRPALVEYKQNALRSTTGETILSRATVTLLTPITSNGATGRREPIDPRDKFELPDGTSGPILAVNGLVDPDTLRPYMYQVYLG